MICWRGFDVPPPPERNGLLGQRCLIPPPADRDELGRGIERSRDRVTSDNGARSKAASRDAGFDRLDADEALKSLTGRSSHSETELIAAA